MSRRRTRQNPILHQSRPQGMCLEYFIKQDVEFISLI